MLAHRGREAYESLTHGGGFYRNFFATLKAGTSEAGGGLERLFITGVSPITMDDVTSGFNVGENVTLEPEFNDLLGFTEPEVRGLLELYRDRGGFNQDVDAALDVMREWYNGYRFAKTATGDLYNTDMVLHYLKSSLPNKPMPDDLIDTNIRIDYTKLRHLLLVNQRVSAGTRQLNGNFDLLRYLIGEGEAEADINLSFPLDELDEPENFLSLLYYFGLLGIRGGVGMGSRGEASGRFFSACFFAALVERRDPCAGGPSLALHDVAVQGVVSRRGKRSGDLDSMAAKTGRSRKVGHHGALENVLLTAAVACSFHRADNEAVAPKAGSAGPVRETEDTGRHWWILVLIGLSALLGFGATLQLLPGRGRDLARCNAPLASDRRNPACCGQDARAPKGHAVPRNEPGAGFEGAAPSRFAYSSRSVRYFARRSGSTPTPRPGPDGTWTSPSRTGKGSARTSSRA